MSWNQDHLAPVETLLYRSDLVKVGTFECAADDPCFRVSEPRISKANGRAALSNKAVNL